MQLALRPYATAGVVVVVVGAGLIYVASRNPKEM